MHSLYTFCPQRIFSRVTPKKSKSKKILSSTLRLMSRSSWPKNIRFTILRPALKSMYIWTPRLTSKLSLMKKRPKLIVSFTPSAASTAMKIQTSQSSDNEEVRDVPNKDHVENCQKSSNISLIARKCLQVGSLVSLSVSYNIQI